MRLIAACLIAACLAPAASAQDALQWNGFMLLRAASPVDDGPLETEQLSSQAHLGLDWSPSPFFGAHIHLLARTSDDGSRRGTLGVPEAYVEAHFVPGGDRVRVRAGAFFLPTSRENIDSLWESAYTLTPSALNSWFGEELRPIGVDATYFHGGLMAGATVFRGNDTFGALPAVRGWTMRDHWALLGEWLPVDDEYYSSVSAETDHRLGWSARTAWSNENALVQLTHIDNRADALEHGALFNWATRFDVAALELNAGAWTLAAETGWGPTTLIHEGFAFTSDLRASYVLVSLWSRHGRATARFDQFSVDSNAQRAVTLAFLWTPPGKLRPGFEITTTSGRRRAMAELRYTFSR